VETGGGWVSFAGIGPRVVESLISPSEHEARRLMQARRPRHSWNPTSSDAARATSAILAGGSEEVEVLLTGTAFQTAVWEALRRIPHGEVRTYGEVAALVVRPGAHRAVANACAANRIAILVPCHRVVPAVGGTGGYAWGEEVKQRLLDQEMFRAHERADADVDWLCGTCSIMPPFCDVGLRMGKGLNRSEIAAQRRTFGESDREKGVTAVGLEGTFERPKGLRGRLDVVLRK
jgi:O-6-methylguanine DNA methyltransferase